MAIPGRYATLEVSTDGDTMTPVGGIVDVTYNRDVGEVDITSLSSGGVGEYLQGREDCTIDLSCRLLEADAGQDLLMDAVDGKQFVYYRLKSKSDTARPRIGRAFVSSFSEAGPLDDTAALDATLRCTKLDIPDPALDLRFAETLSLTDQASGNNLITFTRATSATYVGSDGLIKTAASGEARFDHDPTTGESLGLLIEEQRTNLYTDSISWSTASASITSGATAPDGSTSGTIVTSTGGGVFKPSVTVSSGQTVTVGAFVKYVSGGQTITRFGFDTLGGVAGGSSYRLAFNTLTGEVNSVGSLVSSYSVIPHINGWFRVSVTAIATGTGGSVFIAYADAGAVFQIWGAQLELGAFPTSYIPTAGAAVTRNTDEAYITGTNFSSWYNQGEGSLFAQYQRPVDYDSFGYPTGHVVDMNGTSIYFERLSILSDTYLAGDNESAYVATPSAGYTLTFPPSAGARQEVKMCLSVNGSQLSASRDGSAVQSILIARMPNVVSMTIGNFPDTISLPQYKHNGTIKRITYYGSRLNNLMLQHITLREAP